MAIWWFLLAVWQCMRNAKKTHAAIKQAINKCISEAKLLKDQAQRLQDSTAIVCKLIVSQQWGILFLGVTRAGEGAVWHIPWHIGLEVISIPHVWLQHTPSRRSNLGFWFPRKDVVWCCFGLTLLSCFTVLSLCWCCWCILEDSITSLNIRSRLSRGAATPRSGTITLLKPQAILNLPGIQCIRTLVSPCQCDISYVYIRYKYMV